MTRRLAARNGESGEALTFICPVFRVFNVRLSLEGCGEWDVCTALETMLGLDRAMG